MTIYPASEGDVPGIKARLKAHPKVASWSFKGGEFDVVMKPGKNLTSLEISGLAGSGGRWQYQVKES